MADGTADGRGGVSDQWRPRFTVFVRNATEKFIRLGRFSPGFQSFGVSLHILVSYSPFPPSRITGKGVNSQQQQPWPRHSRCAGGENPTQLSRTQKNLLLTWSQIPVEDGPVWTTLKGERQDFFEQA